VGFNLRYCPFVKFVRQAVDRGDIGEIDHIRIFGGHNGMHNFNAEWQYKMPESGGGAMMDIGIHMTDVARYFLGDITSVYGVMSENIWKVEGSEDNAMAVFKNPAGIAATYHVTWAEWKGYRSHVEVYGTKGMARGSYAPMQNLLITVELPDGPTKKVRKFYPEIQVLSGDYGAGKAEDLAIDSAAVLSGGVARPAGDDLGKLQSPIGRWPCGSALG